MGVRAKVNKAIQTNIKEVVASEVAPLQALAEQLKGHYHVPDEVKTSLEAAAVYASESQHEKAKGMLIGAAMGLRDHLRWFLMSMPTNIAKLLEKTDEEVGFDRDIKERLAKRFRELRKRMDQAPMPLDLAWGVGEWTQAMRLMNEAIAEQKNREEARAEECRKRDAEAAETIRAFARALDF